MKTFRWYEREVYGNLLKYPADAESAGVLRAVGGGKTAGDGDINRMTFFEVEVVEVKRSEADANYR